MNMNMNVKVNMLRYEYTTKICCAPLLRWGLRDASKNFQKAWHVHVCHKPHRTLRQRLVRPKDEIADEDEYGVIYNDADYISETARKLGTRLNEHRKSVQAFDLKSEVCDLNRDQGYNLPPIYGTILQSRQNEAAVINSKHSH